MIQRQQFISLLNKDLLSIEESEAIYRFIQFYLKDHPESDNEDFINRVVTRLNESEPIQYILNTAYFGPLNLFVNDSVLIPRPETEELCEWINQRFPNTAMNLLEIGTGSACIPCCLCYYKSNWKVTTLDISTEAIAVANKNIQDLHLEKQITAQIKDALNDEISETDFDLIVSNPPYISTDEALAMESNVMNWEPHIALFAHKDPLIFYKKLAEIFSNQVKGSCELFAEINSSLALETQSLFINEEMDCELITDISGKQRFVHAWKKN
jgi:release factor glutamine methyltransferase